MRPLSEPMRRLAGLALAAMLAAGCSSASNSPDASASGAGSSPSASLAPVITPSPTPIPVGDPAALAVEPVVASGLVDPIGVTNAGDGSSRLFVVQRAGQVRVVNPDGTLVAAPFVDISDRIAAGGERGLLGLAFHPDFGSNGRLFVDYTRTDDGATVISELTASADRSSADPASERILLTISQPFANHNGGQIAFGPDRYLYIGMGDGGSGGDPQGNGQNLQALLGKILRIDVDRAPAPDKAYAIPNDNPYAPGGVAPGAGLPEIWAYGVRNPWRFSFDRGTGDLYIGDVGQNAWEEVDRQAAGSHGGENYGWNTFEATHCFAICDSAPGAIPPIAEYSHDAGCSISGGYVYRGTQQPAMFGVYIFADYCSGTIFTLPAGATTATPRPVADTGLQISSFGEGEDGEIYLVDLSGGALYRVIIPA